MTHIIKNNKIYKILNVIGFRSNFLLIFKMLCIVMHQMNLISKSLPLSLKLSTYIDRGKCLNLLFQRTACKYETEGQGLCSTCNLLGRPLCLAVQLECQLSFLPLLSETPQVSFLSSQILLPIALLLEIQENELWV